MLQTRIPRGWRASAFILKSRVWHRGRVLPPSGVGPAMMGSTPAAEKVIPFYDEDGKGKTLREFIKDVWIKGDN